MTCVEDCPVDRYVILARENRRLLEKHYDNVNEAITTKFYADSDRFSAALQSEWDKCSEGNTAEDACRSAMDCFFGTALTSAKNGFSEDVVRSIVILNKISYATQVETTYDQSLPTSCDFLLKPNVPEPPYEPEPYPYESYPYEHYQPEPYHRNTYQRNPYQRNPYQRNPYQRNPYRRNSYQRNPYKHRN